MAQWLSWLERRPVTAEVVSSSLIWVVARKIKIFASLLAQKFLFDEQVSTRTQHPSGCGSVVAIRNRNRLYAVVAEQADARDLKSRRVKPVPVRFRPAAL